jgi:hydrogenase maturation protease
VTVVVIGYGNTLRGDDGAGPAVAQAIADRALPGVRSLAVPQLTPELAEIVAEANLVVFVDAALMAEDDGIRAVSVQPAQRLESL